MVRKKENKFIYFIIDQLYNVLNLSNILTIVDILLGQHKNHLIKSNFFIKF